MVFESRGQNTTWYQLRTSLWCHNRSRNVANKKEKRQPKRNMRGNARNLLISESLDMFSSIFSHLPTRNSTAQINLWHQSDVTARSFWIKLDPFPWPFVRSNSTTLKACNIVNFKPKLLKLWKRLFLMVNSKTRRIQFSVHRHFKLCSRKAILWY